MNKQKKKVNKQRKILLLSVSPKPYLLELFRKVYYYPATSGQLSSTRLFHHALCPLEQEITEGPM